MQKIILGSFGMAAAISSASTWAQSSSVQLYGIVDAAVRHTLDSQGSSTRMEGGGMSQSRWGIKLYEDLGAGNAAIANLEARFLTDTGEQASSA